MTIVAICCVTVRKASFTSMLNMMLLLLHSFMSKKIDGKTLAAILLLAGENSASRSLSIQANSSATNLDLRNQICLPCLSTFSRQVLTNRVESTVESLGMLLASVSTCILLRRFSSQVHLPSCPIARVHFRSSKAHGH